MPPSAQTEPGLIAQAIDEAARAIAAAPALCVTAGAGMGVDSGLPDFRGDQGFWRAYPPFARLGLGFVDVANPRWFRTDPELAWGFYGHRLELYRRTTPHEGFAALLRVGRARPHGVRVFTSNVDGQFQRAGFPAEHVVECHGSLHHLQCVTPCRDGDEGIFPAAGVRVTVDEATFRAIPPLPRCPACGGLARPNVLMFGDGGFLSHRSDRQERRLVGWLRELPAPPVIVELGAGQAVATVRHFGEQLARATSASLVRVNLREPQGPPGTIGVALPAREAALRIEARLGELAAGG